MLWIKSFHLIFVVTWFAGLFYLPRLFVYHAQVAPFSEAAERYKKQERLLLKAIMNPAMIAAWLTGLAMVFTPGIVDWSTGWAWGKAIGVVVLTWSHMVFGRMRKALVEERRASGKAYRIWNEVPTLAMILVVLMVIARPI